MPFFSRLVYSLLYTLFIVAYGPYYLLRTAARRQAPIPWLERLGRVPTRLASPCPGAPHGIWIHAVSVGEVNLLRPLVTVLSQQPGPLFISTVTETGQALARELFGQEAEIFYFPLDFAWSCQRYLDRIRPQQILIVETEIWPNFIWQAARRSIPVSIINGRISDASFKKYHRVRVFLAPFCPVSTTFACSPEKTRGVFWEWELPKIVFMLSETSNSTTNSPLPQKKRKY